ncbi:hypothetical protein [Nocardia brasiliensis]|uniref:hypothetical protein n=1 Tax=Nocardia brasiliensis TaxID=37326 RepID=UPI0036712DE5
MPKRDNDFYVLLGPDYAGKSTVLSALATGSQWQLISVDENLLHPRHALLGTLRRHLVEDVLAAPPGTYSDQFAFAMMQCAVVHLHDRIRAAAPGAPLLVDSYYYKILAKCRLVGAGDHPIFTWWRTLPAPQHVVYLDVSPETAWRRSGFGSRLNPMEQRDAAVATGEPYADFATFQIALRAAMLDEIADVPVTVVHEQPGVAETVAAVRKVLQDSDVA